MLDAYIIEEIRRREEDQDDCARPRLRIDIPGWPTRRPSGDDDAPHAPPHDEDGGEAIRIDL